MKINNKVLLTKLMKKINSSKAVDTLLYEFFPDDEKRPKKRKPHVGIEVECYSKLKEHELRRLVFLYDLDNYVNLTNDGSIRPERGHRGHEIRILIPENELGPVFKKLEKFFDKAKLKTNHSCGLHVHLDMRNRSEPTAYNRLLKFQDVMFSMVKKDRWRSRFCEYVVNEEVQNSRYLAINREAYERHRTLEVRLHHGTTDTKRIYDWVKFLIAVVNYRGDFSAIEKKTDVLKIKKLDPKIKKYLKKTVDGNWFTEKNKIVPGIARRINNIVAARRQELF